MSIPPTNPMSVAGSIYTQLVLLSSLCTWSIILHTMFDLSSVEAYFEAYQAHRNEVSVISVVSPTHTP